LTTPVVAQPTPPASPPAAQHVLLLCPIISDKYSMTQQLQQGHWQQRTYEAQHHGSAMAAAAVIC
jgi:hypothetical protein